MNNVFKNIKERFLSTDHAIAKTIGAFCVLMIPVLSQVSFNNVLWNDYKNLLYILLSMIAFACNFTTPPVK